MSLRFLPGVPAAYVLERLSKAGGNEVESGKLAHPESSAALAVNCFGWFALRPGLLPPFPGLERAFPATRVELEYEARFPWPGGRHPWLDAAVVTATHMIGVESKRYEPFRDRKSVVLSDAYDRAVWGGAMGPFEAMRDDLRRGTMRFDHLDAAQLVKHAFGLVTEARRLNKRPALVYLFAEPSLLGGKPIAQDERDVHRAEIAEFAAAVAGAAVDFRSVSYREWIASWPTDDAALAAHGAAIVETFDP